MASDALTEVVYVTTYEGITGTKVQNRGGSSSHSCSFYATPEGAWSARHGGNNARLLRGRIVWEEVDPKKEFLK